MLYVIQNIKVSANLTIDFADVANGVLGFFNETIHSEHSISVLRFKNIWKHLFLGFIEQHKGWQVWLALTTNYTFSKVTFAALKHSGAIVTRKMWLIPDNDDYDNVANAFWIFIYILMLRNYKKKDTAMGRDISYHNNATLCENRLEECSSVAQSIFYGFSGI